MEDDPFPDLNISSSAFLNDLDERTECSKCKKRRKYYCYTCYLPVEGTEELVPKVKLPLKIDIIKHPNECNGKSSAIHAAVLATEDVTIYTYPCIPDYTDKDKTVLVFPSKTSLTIEDHAKTFGSIENIPVDHHQCTVDHDSSDSHNNVKKSTESGGAETTVSSENVAPSSTEASADNDSTETSASETNIEKSEASENYNNADNTRKRKHQYSDGDHPKSKSRKVYAASFDRAVFVDSTWNQTRRITSDERLKGLRCIELKTRETKFWRHQKDNPATYLSTVEAIYYLTRDYHDLFVPKEYEGEYDNLLFFFKFMYHKIKQNYDGGKNLKAYKERAEKKAQNKIS